MTLRIRQYLLPLATFALLGFTANAAPTPARTPAMTQQDAQPQASMKTWCFGRFLIDLPVGATLSGGQYKYDFAEIKKPEPMSIEQFEQQADAREAELRAQKHRTELSLLREARHPDKKTRIIAYWENDYQDYGVEIEGKRWVNGTRFHIQDEAILGKQDLALKMMQDYLARLRPRSTDDIPTDPGFCFDGGFVADEEWKTEELLIAFRWKDMPDASFSVHVFPTEPDKPLLDRKSGALQSLGAFAAGVRTLRERDRPIGPFKGQEILMTVPNSGAKKGHLFIWETQGEGTLERPYIDMTMGTGHSDGKGNAQQTRLTDEQAMALWDSIVSTLRLRPVGPAKTSSATPAPTLPLGELAKTGAVCEQSGWWRCAESGAVEGGSRRYFKQGEVLPEVVRLGDPSMWQRVRGEHPRHRLATVWRLDGYPDEPATAGPAEQAPASPSAEGSS